MYVISSLREGQIRKPLLLKRVDESSRFVAVGPSPQTVLSVPVQGKTVSDMTAMEYTSNQIAYLRSFTGSFRRFLYRIVEHFVCPFGGSFTYKKWGGTVEVLDGSTYDAYGLKTMLDNERSATVPSVTLLRNTILKDPSEVIDDVVRGLTTFTVSSFQQTVPFTTNVTVVASAHRNGITLIHIKTRQVSNLYLVIVNTDVCSHDVLPIFWTNDNDLLNSYECLQDKFDKLDWSIFGAVMFPSQSLRSV